MKALILNFAAFDGKKDTSKPPKHYYRFAMFDCEGKALYEIFQEQQYTEIPDGAIPTPEEQKDTFPRIADVDFSIDQFRNKQGRMQCALRVRAIKSWKQVDLKKL